MGSRGPGRVRHFIPTINRQLITNPGIPRFVSVNVSGRTARESCSRTGWTFIARQVVVLYPIGQVTGSRGPGRVRHFSPTINR
jgi:hypothetical protein